MRITTYKQAFEIVLGVTLTPQVLERVKKIEEDGYYEKGICYAIWRSQDKLLRMKADPRFWSILHNEVRKHAFRKGTSTRPAEQLGMR